MIVIRLIRILFVSKGICWFGPLHFEWNEFGWWKVKGLWSREERLGFDIGFVVKGLVVKGCAVERGTMGAREPDRITFNIWRSKLSNFEILHSVCVDAHWIHYFSSFFLPFSIISYNFHLIRKKGNLKFEKICEVLLQ